MGILVGLAGINHGIFEMMQGNTRPEGLLIAAIGPAQRFWVYGEETALTIVPNFLLSGILAVIFGVIVVIWAGWFIERKHGALILMLLCVSLFLVGGGFAPIFMAILASLAATRINKPLTTWRRIVPKGMQRFLAALWPWSLIFFVIVFVISVEIAIFGWPLTAFFNPEQAFTYLNNVALIMVGMMVLSILTALATDAYRMDEGEAIPHG
jgi:hypothetical protein